jgi:DNA ligase-associated metallophosphoesterase
VNAAPSGAAAEVRWGGRRLLLLADRAAWLPDESMLLVADVHIGKALAFRRLGVPVPQGTTRHTLERLSSLLRLTAARELVLLGDFLHAAPAQAPAVQSQLAVWRAEHAGVGMRLVRGNHDRHAGDPAAQLGIEVVDEPWPVPGPSAAPDGPALALCHHPRPWPGHATLAGHLHPCIRLAGPARSHLRLPCFHFAAAVGILPAFGAFTGMHPVRRAPGDRVFAVADGEVMAV